MTKTGHVSADARRRLLIEDWLPIAEIGIESLRERTSDDAVSGPEPAARLVCSATVSG